ncbi:MAG: hypothetical protein HY072_07525, partial [Deltaproteobacteria bacterium]|nr:hypothetical protein [Deltaproteobacteria bacterium]
KLPPGLVASFRSTLEELHEANLLVHVVDGSSSQIKEQYMVTENILKELKVIDTPRLTVLNKMDLIKTHGDINWIKVSIPGAVSVSAFNVQDMLKLRNLVLDYFKSTLELWEILLPYAESRLEAKLYEQASIENKRHLEHGTFYRLKIDANMARQLNLQKFRI